MPIFMDRHDMRGSTAENVAEAHRKDLEIQDKYGVKYMSTASSAGNWPTPVMINNSESQNYLINIKAP